MNEDAEKENEMNVPTVTFGASDRPDKAIGVAGNGFFSDEKKYGVAITFHALSNPGELEYHERPKSWDQIQPPFLALLFHRIEPIDTLIGQLQKAKELFLEEKDNGKN